MSDISQISIDGNIYNIKDAVARADLAAVKPAIAALQANVGDPIPVSSFDNTLDTTKVYVYVGTTDANYTQGHWYYYNGSAWTDGGDWGDGVTIDATLSNSGQAADAKATGDAIDELKSAIEQIEPGLSDDAKIALLTCFQKVAWIDEHGQDYYDALYESLYPQAVSISAVFAPGSRVFYETDTLNALKPYLTVRATMPDSTVKVVTNYVLSGSMEVGTNTITVTYQGLTDTFNVAVEANPAYITAVYTQPQTTIYTDDALDSLKTDLVVTYYSAPGATGTVLSDSDYVLIGTLTAGTSVITAEYSGLTATFEVSNVIDFYNNYTWSYSNGLLGGNKGGVSVNATYPNDILITDYQTSTSRRFTYTSRGKRTFADWNSGAAIASCYPIPVPVGATKAVFHITPNTQYLGPRLFSYDPAADSYTSVQVPGWVQDGYTMTLSSTGANLFLTTNLKYDAGGTSYPTPPSAVSIEFEQEVDYAIFSFR